MFGGSYFGEVPFAGFDVPTVTIRPPAASATASATAPTPAVSLTPPSASATASSTAPQVTEGIVPPAGEATASAPRPEVTIRGAGRGLVVPRPDYERHDITPIRPPAAEAVASMPASRIVVVNPPPPEPEPPKLAFRRIPRPEPATQPVVVLPPEPVHAHILVRTAIARAAMPVPELHIETWEQAIGRLSDEKSLHARRRAEEEMAAVFALSA